jgi:two-component system, OmpR family, phosphate regulon response regulator OmpR
MMERARIEIPDHAPHVLVVDDDRRLRQLLARFLSENGYRVTTAASAAEARAKGEALVFDAIVLDVMMPGETGFDYARRLRVDSPVPILMLTARANPEDRVTGLEIGADDYLPKPFELSVLIARVGALLRRRGWGRPPELSPAAEPTPAERYAFSGREIDFAALELRRDGKTLPLTLMEANLLRFLVQREGQIVSRKDMLEQVWGVHEDTDTRAIDNFIVRLRRYIEDNPAEPRHLQTIRSVGYRFIANP